jgi:hypothetical protein
MCGVAAFRLGLACVAVAPRPFRLRQGGDVVTSPPHQRGAVDAERRLVLA